MCVCVFNTVFNPIYFLLHLLGQFSSSIIGSPAGAVASWNILIIFSTAPSVPACCLSVLSLYINALGSRSDSFTYYTNQMKNNKGSRAATVSFHIEEKD